MAERLPPSPDLIHDNPCKFTFANAARVVFLKFELVLSQTTLLTRPGPSVMISMTADTSDYSVGAVMQQPLVFLSLRFTPTGMKFSASGQESLTAYNATELFCQVIEGIHLNLCTNYRSPRMRRKLC